MEGIAVDINRDELDIEWLRQPNMMEDACRALADARLAHSGLKADLELCEAELSLHIRKNPEDFSLDKTTEAVISAVILTQEKYQKKLKRLNEAKQSIDVAEALTTALHHKKAALENLVQLQAQGYFSTPKAPPEARERMNSVERKHTRRKGRND
jgi:hypothetical protein